MEESKVYSFEDEISFMGSLVKDLTLDDLYYIYKTYKLSVVVNIFEKSIELVSEE